MRVDVMLSCAPIAAAFLLHAFAVVLCVWVLLLVRASEPFSDSHVRAYLRA